MKNLKKYFKFWIVTTAILLIGNLWCAIANGDIQNYCVAAFLMIPLVMHIRLANQNN